MGYALEVSGNTIWLGSYKVGLLTVPESTSFFDEVVDMINNSNTEELEKEQEAALKDVEDEATREKEDLELQIEKKDKEIAAADEEISDLENQVAELEATIREIEEVGGVAGKIKELTDENAEHLEMIRDLQRKVRELTPQPKRTYRKRAA